MVLTYQIAMAAGRDAGNRSMKANGRTSWNEVDYNIAVETTSSLMELNGQKLRSPTGGQAGGLPAPIPNPTLTVYSEYGG